MGVEFAEALFRAAMALCLSISLSLERLSEFYIYICFFIFFFVVDKFVSKSVCSTRSFGNFRLLRHLAFLNYFPLLCHFAQLNVAKSVCQKLVARSVFFEAKTGRKKMFPNQQNESTTLSFFQ